MRAPAIVLAASLLACGAEPPTPSGSGSAVAPTAALPAGLALDAMPENARSVSQLKSRPLAVGAEVVVEGIVGGRDRPFVDGRASLLVADSYLLEKCQETCAEGDVIPAGFG